MTIEKCKKCKKELGWQKMWINSFVHAWMCSDCHDLFNEEYHNFKKKFFGEDKI